MKFNKLAVITALCIAAGSAAGCSKQDGSNVKIAVMGCEDTYEDGYLNGIKLAVKAAQEQYSDYNIEVYYYDDEENYARGASIIDEIVNSEDVTAVIGSQTPAICESAAYSFEKAGITMLAPYTVYDSMLNDNQYKGIFSMCYSQETVGNMLFRAMTEEAEGPQTIALCYCEDQSGKDEARSFAAECDKYGVEIADCVKLNDVQIRFDEIYSRWTNLGVNTVVIMPYDLEGFDVLKEIKDRNPEMRVLGDFMFDNIDEIEKAGEAFDGFMFVNPFFSDDDYGETGRKYKEEYGEDMNKWAMHGYDAVMMITEAAVNSDNISEYIHENGYKSYAFDYGGRLESTTFSYEVYSNGELVRRYIEF